MTPEMFAQARRLLSQRLIAALVQLFLGLKSWRDDDAAAFVSQVVPIVAGGQRALAALTATFVATQASEALGRTIAPPGIPDSAAVALRQGVTPDEVYRRPFVTLYTALSEGKTLEQARELGRARLAEIAEADLQQTYAHASQAAMQRLPANVRPRFWRRVLIGPENCAMCVIASTQRYHVEALNPIHPGCNCEVRPIFGADPGQVIEPELLEQAHAAAKELTGKSDRGGRAVDYRKLMTRMTPEHGELGRMLVRPLDHFTGPKDLRSS